MYSPDSYRDEDWNFVSSVLQIFYLNHQVEEELVPTKKAVNKLNPIVAKSPHSEG